MSAYPTRVISGDEILEIQYDLSGNAQHVTIGRTTVYCDEVEKALIEAIEKAEKYYNRLIELGDIEKPKTAEDMLTDQQEINAELVKAIERLSQKIESLEREKDGSCKNGTSNDSDDESRVGGKGKKGVK